MGKIPKIIFQSWKTKNLDKQMSQAVETVKKLNPEYQHFLFDDDDCRQFLYDNFGENHLNAFNTLISGAFKCDFWRYCVLYVYGGVYIDIDMVPLVPLREMYSDDDEFVSVADRNVPFVPNCNIYQAFMAVIPHHPIMYDSMMISLYNIATRRYDIFDLFSMTGPVVVGVATNLYLKNKNTISEFSKAGEYPNHIRLHRMDGKYTVDKNNRKLFQNTFEGYVRGPFNYGKTVKFYNNDPRYTTRYGLLWTFISFVIIIIIVSIIVFIFKHKWNKCENECVYKSSDSL